jgi:uncharacterized protein
MKNERIIIIDALRGFALLMIILLHFVQYFDMQPYQNMSSIFTTNFDGLARKFTSVVIYGKAYSVFAFLFGFSFFIQMNNKAQSGIDFRWRFLWRLTILFFIGILDSLFYNGDILHFYAIVGLLLIALYKVNSKALWFFVIILMLQIPMIAQLFINSDPVFKHLNEIASVYSDQSINIYQTGSMFEVNAHNLFHGQIVGYDWFLNQDRFLQTSALFILGLILGRKKVFAEIDKYKNQIKKIIAISLIAFVIFTLISISLSKFNIQQKSLDLLHIILRSYYNIAFTLFLAGGFILCYQRFPKAYIFNLFQSYGKMSLTNYVSQSVFGVIFFYGFGLGMYKYVGAAWCLIFGVIVFFTQAFISKWWATKFYYGPLEWLWRSLTFLDFKTKFVKRKIVEVDYAISEVSDNEQNNLMAK